MLSLRTATDLLVFAIHEVLGDAPKARKSLKQDLGRVVDHLKHGFPFLLA